MPKQLPKNKLHHSGLIKKSEYLKYQNLLILLLNLLKNLELYISDDKGLWDYYFFTYTNSLWYKIIDLDNSLDVAFISFKSPNNEGRNIRFLFSPYDNEFPYTDPLINNSPGNPIGKPIYSGNELSWFYLNKDGIAQKAILSFVNEGEGKLELYWDNKKDDRTFQIKPI